MKEIDKVGIEIGQNVYSTFESLSNSVSNVLAEFIDNAIQSYRDNKEVLQANNPSYVLHIDIRINWNLDSEARANSIIIRDNAAGINEVKYVDAFKPAIKPEDSTGLNEFGMGLKTAACWLGDTWSVVSKAYGEDDERTLIFDRNEVTENNLRELPVSSKKVDNTEHYTIVSISDLTSNAPLHKNAIKIKDELASIYRKFLRTKELYLTFCDEIVEYKEPEVLYAPFHSTPDQAPILWKKEINVSFRKYKATGFIGLLKTMSGTQNGVVLLRRGRVILGADYNGRYHNRALCGQTGSPRYKRLFGELELEGFNVSFNKNDIRDKDNLDALLEAIVGELHTRDFDLIGQGDKYREDQTRKAVDKIVKTFNNQPKSGKKPIEISSEETDHTPTESTPSKDDILNKYDQSFIVDGVEYGLSVQFIKTPNNYDIFWLDTSKSEENQLICNINVSHQFFEHFGEPRTDVVAIFKSLAIAKFVTKNSTTDNSAKLLQSFNNYLEKIEV